MHRSLLFLLVPITATAQPVIQYANVDLLGKTFAVHLVTDPGSSDPNTDGENVTWDFSSATLLMDAGSTTFHPPASTPYGASYPGSNLAQSVTVPGSTTYSYFNLSSTQLDMLAEGIGGSDERIYSDPKTPLQFPFAYPDYFIDYYTENGTDYSVSRAYMGYGTVILPTGTYTNVVKMASTSGSIDFFKSDPVEQLVNIDSDGTVLVFGDAVTAVDERGLAASLNVWPAPATDLVNVSGIERPGTWELLDTQGRAQRQGRHLPGMLTLDLGGLSSGAYVLVLRDGVTSQRVKLSKQ